MLKLSLRYWRVHWKKLVKVLFAMILSSAALMIAFLLARSSTEKSVQDVLNVNGNYDIVVQDLTKSQLDKAQDAGDKDVKVDPDEEAKTE